MVHVLPVACRSRNTWHGWGVSFVQEWMLIIYCLETPKFVVIANWL